MANRDERPAPNLSGEFLNDAEAAHLLRIGTTRLAEIQRDDPTFPQPVWLGERAKRHVKTELMAWALNKRRPAARAVATLQHPRRRVGTLGGKQEVTA